MQKMPAYFLYTLNFLLYTQLLLFHCMNQNLIKAVLEYRLHLQYTQNRESSVGFRTDLNKLLPVQEKDNSFERVISPRVKNKEALTSGVLVNNWVQMGLIVDVGGGGEAAHPDHTPRQPTPSSKASLRSPPDIYLHSGSSYSP